MAILLTAFRRALTLATVALLTLAVLASGAFAAQDAGDDTTDEGAPTGVEVDILPVKGLLDPPVADAIVDVITSAEARGSSLVVLQLDHAGVVSADLERVVAAIEASAVPVAVFIGPQGIAARAGGGTLLLLGAAHIRAAAPDARLGPLVPVDVGDEAGAGAAAATDRLLALWPELADTGLATPDSSLVRTADAAAADALPGVAAEELSGALDRVVPGLEPLLTELDGVTVDTAGGAATLRIRRDEVDNVRFHTLGLVRRMLHAATTPVFIYLLLAVGLAMLLFEVFQPGFGVAGLAGLITVAIGVFGLSVLPVAWWAVALVVLGLVLFAVDTAIAGFGPVTVAAAATFGIGSWFFYDSPVVGLPAWLVVLTTVAAAVFFVVVLTSVLRAQAGPEDLALEDLVGKLGIVRSVLNPEGHVFVDDALWRARWVGEARRAKVGTPIRVTGVEGPKLLVEEFDPEMARAGDSEAARNS